MKKILLLSALSCCFMLQAEIVFGKCNTSISFIRHSDMSTGSFQYASTEPFFISPEDTITFTFHADLLCNGCITIWELNGNIIQQGVDTLNVTAGDSGYYLVYKYSCIAPGCNFTIVESLPTGINTLSSVILQFPFSKAPDINTNNIRYKIINPLGQIMEQGKFSGEIILRTQNSSRHLMPGIYFVIYSDADDNRQVLTDKVMVSNQ